MGKKKPAKTTETAQAMLSISVEGLEMDLPLSQLCRHPDNREPSEADVAELAFNLATTPLLEPLVVRQLSEAIDITSEEVRSQGLYEIISGETRSLAARKLGWTTIRCRVIQADDATALKLLAVANGQRKNLNPIQQAKLIERLCADAANGGGGMTRADAALAVGLESASAASNAVGLLRLPEIWQQRIASGKLPATFGRTMLPACEVPAVFGSLEESWGIFEEAVAEDDEWEIDANDFGSRSKLEKSIEHLLEAHTRPCDKRTHWYSNLGLMFNQADQPMLFKLTPELEKSLDVKKIRIGGEDRLVATNVEAYEALQIPLIQKKAKGKNAPVADDDGEKRPLTPAEQKAKKKLAAEKLAKRVEEWRFNWIRSIVSKALSSKSGVEGDLFVGLAHQLLVFGAADMERVVFDDAIMNLLITTERPFRKVSGDTLDHVLSIQPNDTYAMVRDVAATAVMGSEKWPRHVMEHAMRWLQQDLTSHWAILQSDQTAEAKERLEEFYAIFTSDQLGALAKEFKEPQVERVNSKREKVEILLEGVYLNLPKVLQEIEQPKAKSKKGA